MYITMGRPLSKSEFHKRHIQIITLARQQISMAEIARQTGKNKKAVSCLITTARQREIDIPYKRKPKKVKAQDAKQSLIVLVGRAKELLGEKHRPLNGRKIKSMFERGASVDVIAEELAAELNIPSQKAHALAQTYYYIRKLK